MELALEMESALVLDPAQTWYSLMLCLMGNLVSSRCQLKGMWCRLCNTHGPCTGFRPYTSRYLPRCTSLLALALAQELVLAQESVLAQEWALGHRSVVAALGQRG